MQKGKKIAMYRVKGDVKVLNKDEKPIHSLLIIQ